MSNDLECGRGWGEGKIMVTKEILQNRARHLRKASTDAFICDCHAHRDDLYNSITWVLSKIAVK